MPEIRTVVLQDGEEIYTEAELKEAVDQACGEYVNTKLYQEGYRAGVKAEREACTIEADNWDTCASEAIRKRGKE